MIEAFRLALRRYAAPLSGNGAALRGGRWNSKGVEMVYAATNRSLAMVEVVVHTPPGTIPPDYVMVTIAIPDDLPNVELDESRLPRGWSGNYFVTQRLGDEFVLADKYCAMRVPSAVTPGDSNLLINPHHAAFPDIKIIKVEKFSFDERLFRSRP